MSKIVASILAGGKGVRFGYEVAKPDCTSMRGQIRLEQSDKVQLIFKASKVSIEVPMQDREEELNGTDSFYEYELFME